MLPNSMLGHRSASNSKEDKVKLYLDYCRNLQTIYSGSSSDESVSSSSLKQRSNRNLSKNNLQYPDIKDRNFLLDSFLENKLQASFKQLNHILEYPNNNPTINKEDSDKDIFEIFFLHDQQNTLEIETNVNKRSLNLQAPTTVAGNIEHHHHPLDRRSSSHESNKIYDEQQQLQDGKAHSKCLDDLKEQQKEKRDGQFTTDQVNINTRLNSLEKLIRLFESGLGNNNVQSPTTDFNPLKDEDTNDNDNDDDHSQLFCLVLTHPDNKLKRDSLIYSYPFVEPSNKIANDQSKISKLTSLNGMFVTLFNVINKLPPKTSLHPSYHHSPQILSSSKISFQNKNNVDYWLSFIVEKNDDDYDISSSINNNKPIPIILSIALPSDCFDKNETKAITELLDHLLRIRFGSLSNAFRNCPITRISNFMDKLLSVLNKVLPVWNRNFLGSCLSLSNTYPILRSILHDDNSQSYSHAASLIFQRLFIDESIVFNLFKYLNDYDSLDWIDESIQFYKDDGNDIEQALSEHFARCLQFESSAVIDPDPAKVINGFSKSSDLQSSLFMDNNHLFDLLEIELTFFTVIGSCLFYRGFFVHSLLPYEYLNSIYNILFSKGILAATKHRNYYLVYFTRFLAKNNTPNNTVPPKQEPNQTDLFLLIIGHGHLVHCALIQVYRFDRSGYNNFPSKYGLKPTESLQLPSSFAFYVFIKESFRLLRYYLDRFSLHDQLEESFLSTQKQTTTRLIRLFESTFFAETDSSWIDKLNPFNFIRSNISRHSQHEKLTQLHKLMPDAIKKSKKRKGSDEINYQSHHRHSFAGPLMAESNCKDSLSLESINTHSTTDSITFNYDPSYRLHQEYLPESLICFLNIDLQMGTFYGPIVGHHFEFETNEKLVNGERFLKNVTSEICSQINKLRKTLLKTSQIEIKRRQNIRSKIVQGQSDGDISQYRSQTKTTTMKTLKLLYESNGDPVSDRKSNCLCLNLCLLGRCDVKFVPKIDQDKINGEFYACFLLNPSASISANNRYSVGKFIFPNNESFSNINIANNSDQEGKSRINNPITNINSNNNHSHYEMDNLDILMADLDELIENVRMENR